MTTPATRLERFQIHKATWKEQLLLLRYGDLYESFSKDAATIAKCLSDTTSDRAGQCWWGCEASSLEVNLRRLLRAGHRVAVGDVIDGEDEIIESTGEGIAAVTENLEWPTRPIKAESSEGHLLDIWISKDGEVRVRRVDPLDGPGWYDAQALVSQADEEDEWKDLGRTENLRQALNMALTQFQGTAPSRHQAHSNTVELLDHAHRMGLDFFPKVNKPKNLADSAESVLILDPDSSIIEASAQNTEQSAENVMSEETTATMIEEQETTTTLTEGDGFVSESSNGDTTAAETGAEVESEEIISVPPLVLTEGEARNLATELGWRMAAKDLPIKDVMKHLNGILTKTPLEDLEKPSSPDCRAQFKLLQKTIKAGGSAVIGDGGGSAEEGTETQAVVAKPKKKKTTKAITKQTSKKSTVTSSKRSRVLDSYPAGPFVRWLGRRGVDFDGAKKILKDNGCELSDQSIRWELKEVRDDRPPAKVSAEHRHELVDKYGGMFKKK